jgi:hypothetical protein
MWEPRRLTTLWASTACCRDSFTFTYMPWLSLNATVSLIMPIRILGRLLLICVPIATTLTVTGKYTTWPEQDFSPSTAL